MNKLTLITILTVLPSLLISQESDEVKEVDPNIERVEKNSRLNKQS